MIFLDIKYHSKMIYISALGDWLHLDLWICKVRCLGFSSESFIDVAEGSFRIRASQSKGSVS